MLQSPRGLWPSDRRTSQSRVSFYFPNSKTKMFRLPVLYFRVIVRRITSTWDRGRGVPQRMLRKVHPSESATRECSGAGAPQTLAHGSVGPTEAGLRGGVLRSGAGASRAKVLPPSLRTGRQPHRHCCPSFSGPYTRPLRSCASGPYFQTRKLSHSSKPIADLCSDSSLPQDPPSYLPPARPSATIIHPVFVL